jgi:hypothetical protein
MRFVRVGSGVGTLVGAFWWFLLLAHSERRTGERIGETPLPGFCSAKNVLRMFQEKLRPYPLEAPKAKAILRKLFRNGNEMGR